MFSCLTGAVFGVQKSAHTLDQAPEYIEIKLIATTKGMDYLSLGIALVFVPDIVGQLHIFDDRIVFIFFV